MNYTLSFKQSYHAYSKCAICAIACRLPLHLISSPLQVHVPVARHDISRRLHLQVRHPGVDTLMQRDFALMLRAAQLSKYLPVLSELRLDESVQQFGAPLKEQLDLAAEARHLARFSHNFRCLPLTNAATHCCCDMWGRLYSLDAKVTN